MVFSLFWNRFIVEGRLEKKLLRVLADIYFLNLNKAKTLNRDDCINYDKASYFSASPMTILSKASSPLNTLLESYLMVELPPPDKSYFGPKKPAVKLFGL